MNSCQSYGNIPQLESERLNEVFLKFIDPLDLLDLLDDPILDDPLDTIVEDLLEAIEYKMVNKLYETGSIEDDARRYRYIRENYQWRRSDNNFIESDNHTFVGVKFPLDDNFSCPAMLDHNLDKLIYSNE